MSKTRPVRREMVREQLFDAGWRFCRSAAEGADFPNFDDAAWQAIDLPHDWSLDDLPPQPPPTEPTSLAVVAGVWRFRKGDDPAWQAPDLDETDWETVTLPAAWEDHSNYTTDNVYGWFRRRLDVPAALRGKDFDLLLGKIDDVDEAFLNGVRIGGRGAFPPNFASAWNDSRVYPVAARLVRGDGTDVLAVRVFDGQGRGGIYEAPLPPVRVGPFDTAASGGGRDTGYVVGGIGWYRKCFRLPAATRGKRAAIRFDGIYMDSDVWLNGQHLGNHPYGYTSFAYDLTPHLKPAGEVNVLAVRVRNVGHNSRWYSGSGIYRHAWLTVTNPVHVGLWGVCVTTPEVTPARATIRLATTVENASDATVAAAVRVQILDPKGVAVGSGETAGTITGGASATLTQDVAVPRPRRWSVDTPNLYVAQVDVVTGDQVVDCTKTVFGIRTFSFDARAGFQLNGVSLKLKGACIHHDNGPLGSATIDRAEERRIELLKANGYNAIRTSHNPPSPAFLDACDRLGMLVMDESFDMWRQPKNAEDYHRFFDQWWQADTDSMVRRDRNHPSIVIWSIGNEIPERYEADGVKSAKMQADRVRELDPTRPVTSAFCGVNDQADPFFAVLDVAGYNYAVERYVSDHQRHPGRVMAATESFPLYAFEYWMGVLDHPHVVGDFVWTGMDYFGESGIGFAAWEKEGTPERWPYHGAVCGDLDVCGFKRAPSYYRDILWDRSKLEMAVRRPDPAGRKEWLSPWGWPDEQRSWTWPDCEDVPLLVNVYSTAEEVRLTLNGREIGVKPVSRATRFTASFQVPYQPGRLRATALVRGKAVASTTFRTAGPPRKLRLTVDRARIAADRNDLAYVTVEVLDQAGTVVPHAAAPVRFKLTGPGELAAVGNGDQRHAASLRVAECLPYRGRCLAILRPRGRAGTIALRAEAAGLPVTTVKIVTRA